MKVHIFYTRKEVCIEPDELPDLEGWTIYMRRPNVLIAEYETQVGGMHTLAELVRAGPRPSPPCCNCACHAKG